MAKKCIPGVICFENITIVVIFIVLIFFAYYFYKQNSGGNGMMMNGGGMMMNGGGMMMPPPPPPLPPINNGRGFVFNNSYLVPPRMNDPLLDPYNPPLRDMSAYMMPINIPTQGGPIMEDYRQVGLLTRTHGKETILPLMGQQIFSNRDKWNYYTMSDKNNIVKLPIYSRGKSCMNEYGCDSLNSGDHVHVEGYNDNFKVTLYDNKLMRYIPVF
jgi:hypothetical protein